MSVLNGKNILLGITGSIAAYKAPELLRQIQACNACVKVVMTKGGRAFVSALSLQALSGSKVFFKHLDPQTEMAMSHIELARWADFILIAPASANFIARLVHGFADDLLTTLCLASDKQIFLAPAMNRQMWENKITQKNLLALQNLGYLLLGPEEGEQACGETGYGRMLEPQKIIQNLEEILCPKGKLKGKRILITAGPTQEPLDPIRYMSNKSSGKMGYAIAKVAAQEGGQVSLVSGPTNLKVPKNVHFIPVKTSQQMEAAVLENYKNIDIFISAAAVSDYVPTSFSEQKIKKNETSLLIQLEKTNDILSTVAHKKDRPEICIGFAAETENLEENALQKLSSKNLDIIIANDVSEGKAIGMDQNEVTLFFKDGRKIFLPLEKKDTLAKAMIAHIADYI